MLAHDHIISSVDEWQAFLQGLHRDISKFIILCDTNTAKHCKPLFFSKYLSKHQDHCIEIDIEVGEQKKTLTTAEMIWSKLQDAAVDRDGCLVAIGGGVVTDIAGFVSCTYKRGIRLVNVPTTHLGMTDAALGGKNGLNFGGLKNQIGSLHFPASVVIDPGFLETLPKKELHSGWIETVKHALIADKTLWNTISSKPLESLVYDRDIILRSATIKMNIAQADSADFGIRQALNFGHTIGHAVEAQTNLLHGEAVAFGIISELYLSLKLTGLNQHSFDTILDYLCYYYPFLKEIELDTDRLINAMQNDKKNSGGEIIMSLIPEIGQIKVGIPIKEHLILEAIHFTQKVVGT